MPFGCDGAMKGSKSLVIKATNIADDQEVFTVSPEGFAKAMNRVAELAK
jgi:invasion protein IalB